MTMLVEIISSRAAFATLKDEWNTMPQALCSPLARHEWFAASLDAFSVEDELALFVARSGGTLRAVAPLIIDRSMGSPRLNILGHQTQEPNEFLYTDEDALAAVCAKVMQSGWPAVMHRLRVESPEMRLLEQTPRRGIMIGRPAPVETARLALIGWESFEATMSTSSKSFIRRKRKIAEREGSVVVDLIAPDQLNVQRHLDEVFRIEGAGWKSRVGTSILANAAMRRFYTAFGYAAAQLGIARLYFLRVGEKFIAARFAVSYAGRLWELKIGYDEQWKQCSPGILLTHETLRLACEEGLVAHEFLGRAEPWQQRWPIEIWRHTTLRYYPVSFHGGLSLGADVCHFGGQRLKAAFSDRRTRELKAAS